MQDYVKYSTEEARFRWKLNEIQERTQAPATLLHKLKRLLGHRKERSNEV